ncbi:MAG: VOC family protein [Geminicoccaceae bacterium]
MTRLLINIDVPDLDRAVAFYRDGLGLLPRRRIGDGAVEMEGAGCPVYVLENREGSKATSGGDTRRFARHWTPLHLDLAVDDLDAAVARATAAGALLEHPAREAPYGRIAVLADPFGHGFCLIEFTSAGYDPMARPW